DPLLLSDSSRFSRLDAHQNHTKTTNSTICLRVSGGGNNRLGVKELWWNSRICTRAKLWFFVVFHVHVRLLRAPRTISGSNLDWNVATDVSTGASIVTTKSFGDHGERAKARGCLELGRIFSPGAGDRKFAFDSVVVARDGLVLAGAAGSCKWQK